MPPALSRPVAIVLLIAALALSQGCLVLALNPAYDDDWIAWEPGLVGQWLDADDDVNVRIEAAEWRSYRVHYEHPIEKGDLTAYLTVIGDARYLDLMPLRGKDPGSFVLPVHAILRVALDGDQLTVTPLSYDWLAGRIRVGRGPGGGLTATLDQKQDALITSPTARLREWLRTTPADAPAWAALTTFSRVKETADR